MEKVSDITTKLNRNVEDLKVFQLAYRVSVAIHKASLVFPKIEQYAIADQVRRASKSVCANLGEGFIKQSYSQVEFRRFIGMALGFCWGNASLDSVL